LNIKDFLGAEVYDKLPDNKKAELNQWVPKTRFDEVVTQKNELKTQVDTLNKSLTDNNVSIEKFKKAAEGNEDLQKQIADYQNKVTDTQKEFGNTLKAKESEWSQREANNRKAYTLREKMLVEHADPKYIDMLMKQVDLNKITEADGKFIGVDDVVKGVKTDYEKLFGQSKVIGTGIQSPFTVGQPISAEALKTMSTADINNNWDAVQATLQQK